MRRYLIPALTLTATVALLGCSSDGSSPEAGSSSTSSTTTAPEPLRILLTNDDGFDSPGIDAVASALDEIPDVELTVVAPATNQSGTGSRTSPTPPAAQSAQTASGREATSVAGFPADSVVHALDTMKLEPHVVVAGINAGQNLGAITELSGTVGAAKTAAARGIPAVAASQGLGDDPQYEVGAQIIVDWVTEHRDALVAGDATVGVVNLNFPTCSAGALRGLKQVPLATDVDGALEPADCASTVVDVTTDIAAFLNGFVAVTQLGPDGQTVTTSTTFPEVDIAP